MKSGSETISREVHVSQVSTPRADGERAGLVLARAFAADAWRYVQGFAIMLVGCCGALVLGAGRNIDVPMRLAFRLHHPHNWPAWIYFGVLQTTVLVLIAHLIVKRCKETAVSDGSDEVRMPAAAWVGFYLAAGCLVAIGEVAMRLAMTSGW